MVGVGGEGPDQLINPLGTRGPVVAPKRNKTIFRCLRIFYNLLSYLNKEEALDHLINIRFKTVKNGQTFFENLPTKPKISR